MKNTGKDFEQLTEQVFKRLLAQGNVAANVMRDVDIPGRSTTHQIDIVFDFIAGPVQYRTIVQCKDWSSPVKQEQVLAFNSVLTDIPGQPRGIIVSRSGFQVGARKVADHHGIKLYELRAPRNDDWDGLIREIHIQLCLRSPKFENFQPIFDMAAIRTEANARGLGTVRIDFQGDPERAFAVEATGDHVEVNRILNSLVPDEGVGTFHLRHDFPEIVVMKTFDSTLPRLPVLALEATVHVGEIHSEVRVSLDHLIAYCFRDILTGEVQFLRKDGGPLHDPDKEDRA